MKRIFNGKIFLEGFMQLKIVGIITTILVAIFGLMMSLNTILSHYPYKKNEIISSDFSLQMQAIVLIFVITVPLMVMVLFYFLNNRNSSDFYHSLPIRRGELYTGFMSAILAWIVIFVVVAAAVPMLVYSLDTHVFWDRTTIFPFLLSVFAGAVLVTGAFAMAVSMTGTGFTNFIVAVMIIFVPRLLMTYILSACTQIIPFISIDFTKKIFSGSHNVVFGFFARYVTGGDAGLSSLGSGIYTLVVGLIYIIVGGILFQRRKSETASKPSMNGVLQCSLRSIPALILSIVGTVLWIHNLKYSKTVAAQDVLGVIIWYILALIAYYLYELVTTRKWKRTLQSTRQLPFIIVINALLALGMLLSFQKVIHFIPDAAQIQSIQIEEMPVDSYLYSGNTDVKITSDTAKTLISKKIRAEMEAFYRDPSNANGYGDNYNAVTVKINLGERKIYRVVYMTDADVQSLLKELTRSEGYSSRKNALPKYYAGMDLYSTRYSIVGTDCIEIYKSLAEEYSNIQNPDEFIKISTMDQFENIGVYSDAKGYYYNIPITWITPKSITMLSDSVNNLYPDFNPSLKSLIQPNLSDYELFYHFELWKNGKRYSADLNYTGKESTASIDAVTDLLKDHEEDRVDTSESILTLEYSIDASQEDSDGYYKDESHFYNLSADEVSQLEKILTFQ